jgi:hypothetical protein
MFYRVIASTVVSLSVVLCLALVASAEEIVGPNSAHRTESVVFASVEGNATVLSTHLASGKPGHVLVVHVSVQDDGYGYRKQRFYFFPTLNGYTMPGGGVAYVNDDSKNGFGSSSGTWFVDLDSWGMATLPLNIDVIGGTVYPYKDDASRTAYVTISAVLQPK